MHLQISTVQTMLGLMPTNRLAELRNAADISQSALSHELGVDASTIWRWEHERVGIPDRQKVVLAERFGVTVGYLMGWDAVAA